MGLGCRSARRQGSWWVHGILQGSGNVLIIFLSRLDAFTPGCDYLDSSTHFVPARQGCVDGISLETWFDATGSRIWYGDERGRRDDVGTYYGHF